MRNRCRCAEGVGLLGCHRVAVGRASREQEINSCAGIRSPGGKTHSACSLRRTTGKISAMCPFMEKLVEQEIFLLSITERGSSKPF